MSILIDADKTIDKWCNKCYEAATHFRNHFGYETIEQCRERSGCWLLKKMSEAVTVDAEPVKHGHWIFDLPYGLPKCSVCGSRCRGGIRYGEDLYCGHCGARMDGEKSWEVKIDEQTD